MKDLQTYPLQLMTRRLSTKAHRISADVVREIRELVNSGQSTAKDAAAHFGYSVSSVNRMLRGHSYKDVDPDYVQPKFIPGKYARSLSVQDVIDIKFGISEGAKNRDLAIRYNVNQSTISGIRHGRLYKGVQTPVEAAQEVAQQADLVAEDIALLQELYAALPGSETEAQTE